MSSTKPAENMGWVMGLEPMTSGITIHDSSCSSLSSNDLGTPELANKQRKSTQRGDICGDSPTTVTLPVGHGRYTQIDISDLPLVRGRRLSTATRNGKHYAVIMVDGRQLTLSRFLLDVPEGVLVDHQDGFTLNNKRCNIRAANYRQNAQNQAKKRTNSRGNPTSAKLRGIHWSWNKKRTAGAWRAQIRDCSGKQITLGQYQDQEEAARVYDAAAIKLHGEFARLNFPLPTGGAA